MLTVSPTADISRSTERVSALEQPDCGTPEHRYRCTPPVLHDWLAPAQRTSRYVPVSGRRSPQRGPEAASGAVHARREAEPFVLKSP